MATQQTESGFFSGLTPAFIGRLKILARQVWQPKGSVIFRQGDAAVNFFTLEAGQVVLCIGKKGHPIYRVRQTDEAFGWSSMAGGDAYIASAICLWDTTVLRYDGKKLKSLLAGNVAEAIRFYQNLSHILDRRLHQSNHLLSSVDGRPKSLDKEDNRIRDTFDLL